MSLLYHYPLPYPSPSPSPSPVKIEQDDPDSRFIMELTHSSSSSPSSPDAYIDPPTEVPLRATQASKEMRRMMGVFRLNPFAMHCLSRGGEADDSPDASPAPSATWSGEAGPLEQEPVMFEFQLHISGGLDREDDGPVLRPHEPSSRLPAISAHDESQLRAFSPTFELPDGDLSELPEPTSSSSTYHIQHDVNDHHPIQEEDPGSDFRQVQCDPWEEADYAPHTGSDSGASSSTTLSVQTPVNEISCSPFDDRSLSHHFPGPSGCPEQTQVSPTVEFPSTPLWDVPQDYQTQDGPSMNYGHADVSQRGGIVHANTSQSYMRITYPPSYSRPYPQPSPQFQQTQTQPSFFHLSMPSPSLPRCSGSNSPNQEIEHIPQSPSTLPPLSPATPNSLQYSSLNQQHAYTSQSPTHHQMPYGASNPVTPTSMPLRLPISIARSAMRSAAAFSNATSPTSCQNQLPPPSPYNMQRGYRVSRRPQLEERIGEHEVYSTPHSPVTEKGYIPSTSVTMGMPTMHPALQRSSTYVGVPQLVTGGSVDSSPVHTNNNRRWSLPEMSIGAYAGNPAVGHGESFLGNHM